MRIRPNFRENLLLKILAGAYAIVWIITAINPVYPSDWMLENILVVIFIVGLVLTYAETPVGFWMQDWFGFDRNHFDRVVHFCFGLLMAYPIREIFLRVAHTRGFFAYYLPFDVTLAFSGGYEIIEMVVAVLVSPEAGDAYLGTQGDIWDAQKDMGLAALGAVLCMVITWAIRAIRQKPHTPDYDAE
ncbi:MAG: DUF2238 domain-containing protein [Bacteroidota bacterium]